MTTKDPIREYFAKVGAKGGKATAKSLTAKERAASARKAARARWAKKSGTRGASARTRAK
jgi:hypothetical protein